MKIQFSKRRKSGYFLSVSNSHLQSGPLLKLVNTADEHLLMES